MKVLLANSPFRGGGITAYATQLVSCLSQDTELIVVLTNDDKAPIKIEGVKVLYYDTERLTINNAKAFINLINKELKPDVVIGSMATIIPVIAPYLNNDIKVITVSHSGKYFSSDYCAVNHKYLDRIIAASSDSNKHYLERKFHIHDKNKIKVIYNFVSDDDEIENLRLKKKDHKPIKLIYAGGSSIGKAPHLMAEILAALLKTDLDFRFYWTGNPKIPLTTTVFKHSKLKYLTQLLPADERVVFPGRVPDKRDFDMLLGSANIMMATSKNEGCSMALLEGHRAGCIFVVADYGNSNSEIVRKGNSGFVVDHNDINAFVDVVRNIITDHSSYYQLYENSHNTFRKDLCYSVWKEKFFSVLNSEPNHKSRNRKISRVGLWMGIQKIKWLYRMSLMNRFMQLSLPAYLSFRKQYHDFKKK